MVTNGSKPIDRAMPVLRMPRGTDAERVESARASAKAMQQSSLWNANPSLQAVVQAWTGTSDALDANAKAMGDLRKQLALLGASNRQLRHDWNVGLKHTLAAAAVVSKGSANLVHELGLAVVTRGVSGGLLPAPAAPTTALGKAVGEAVLSWERGGVKHGFIVQHAVNIADPATFSVPAACTRTKTALKGLVSGSLVHVRIAAIDPASESGQSPWSDWVGATAR